MKVTSKKLASEAAKILQNENSSSIQKTLAGSVLAQRDPEKITGKGMEKIASDVLKSTKYSSLTKSFAGSLVSQSRRYR